MLSRLKSSIKGVVGLVRPKPPEPPKPAARVEAPRPAPVAAVAPKVQAAAPPPAPAPKVEAPKVEAPKVEATPTAATAEAPKAEAPKAEAPKAEAPKKLSIAAQAAAAAKAPAPAPAKATAHDEDDDHGDESETDRKRRIAKEAIAASKAEGGKKHLHADTGSVDKESYILRAKANGRDPATTVIGEEGLNTLEDGTQFWGPVNNSSSRAKAEGKVLTIDQFECISCGTCVEQTDSVFVLPDDSKAVARKQEGPMDAIQDAIEACPVTCIHWTDDPNKFPPLNDEHGVKA